jgi:hypothetical protein
MATTTFTYATQTNFKDYFPHLVSMSDNKNPIYNWEATAVSNRYVAHNTGFIGGLFVDGAEQGSAQSGISDVDSAGDWFYDSGTDALYYFNSSSNPNNLVMESGSDFQTFMNNQLYRASMELNNMLDGRFPNPIPKSFIHSSDPSNDTPEYDAILIKLTCYMAAVNLLRASGEFEQADIIQEQVSNIDGTGMVDKLNAGEYKLSFEIDKTDSTGDVIEVTNTGSMHLVETYGQWTGRHYDRVQLICTTAGAYGTARMTIKTFDGNTLYGSEQLGFEVTGGLDHIGNGIYVRFEGNAMAENDRWDIEVRNYTLKQSNSQGTRSVDAIRNDLSPSKVIRRKRIY